MRRDVLFAVKVWRREKGLLIGCVVGLSVAIAATTATISLARDLFAPSSGILDEDAVAWFRPAPSTQQPAARRVWTFSQVRQLNERATTVDLTATAQEGITIEAEGAPTETMTAWLVSHEFFAVTGGGMTLGRGFASEASNAPEAVLSYGMWMRRFGADPTILGKHVRINSYPYVIVGVADPDFSGPTRYTPGIWLRRDSSWVPWRPDASPAATVPWPPAARAYRWHRH